MTFVLAKEVVPSKASPAVHIETKDNELLSDPLLFYLHPKDVEGYTELVMRISKDEKKQRNNLGLGGFTRHLGYVHNFIYQNDKNDCLRGIICGIQFAKGALLLNTNRLKKLMCRSKSCLNSCFQRLGYVTCRPKQDIVTLLTKLAPSISARHINTRQWCVRKAGYDVSLCFVPYLLVPVAQSDDEMDYMSHPTPQVVEAEPFVYDIASLLNTH